MFGVLFIILCVVGCLGLIVFLSFAVEFGCVYCWFVYCCLTAYFVQVAWFTLAVVDIDVLLIVTFLECEFSCFCWVSFC